MNMCGCIITLSRGAGSYHSFVHLTENIFDANHISLAVKVMFTTISACIPFLSPNVPDIHLATPSSPLNPSDLRCMTYLPFVKLAMNHSNSPVAANM